MAISYTPRPPELDGCWATWTESQVSNVIRTQMENGDIKTRRRTTGILRQASASVTLPSDQYDSFMDWFNIASQGGVQPTTLKEPSGVESVWRFTAPPEITWVDTNAFRASCALERLPGWPVV